MTPEQEAHLKQIKVEFTKLVDSKYRQGQKEHGGDLATVRVNQLLDNTIGEAIDQVVYLLTLKQRLSILMTEITSELI